MDNQRVVVLDHGKSNVKLFVCSKSGDVVESRFTQNLSLDATNWRHTDLISLNEWVLSTLAELNQNHSIGDIIVSAHGSGGVLVGDDNEVCGDGALVPMIDYEQELPADIAIAYEKIKASYLDRGSTLMMGATHLARQLFWIETLMPEAIERARWFLGLPQYWAWRFSDVAASEFTFLGAQSHLWNVSRSFWTDVVRDHKWERILPPMTSSDAVLGMIRPELAEKYLLSPDIKVHAGIHDSSANFYSYKSLGLEEFTVVSTGTWTVALAEGFDLLQLTEALGMTCNSDPFGNPVCGALTMAGREYETIAGVQPAGARADLSVIQELVLQGTMVLPSLSDDNGQFPRSARSGQIVGPKPDTQEQRLALAIIHSALLTVECANTLGPDRTWILDGSYLREPLYAAMVNSIRSLTAPNAKTFINEAADGLSRGAVALCYPSTVLPPTLGHPSKLDKVQGLKKYVEDWQRLARESVE
ncbi:MAG: FGGY family carbohydrate kinase [Proteobacteria bacterium]|nr:FGGY family carbohydrate kinase [Pseudomonadota bacterium]